MQESAFARLKSRPFTAEWVTQFGPLAQPVQKPFEHHFWKFEHYYNVHTHAQATP